MISQLSRVSDVNIEIYYKYVKYILFVQLGSIDH